MAHVVYQASAGFLWVDGMEVPFANVVMEITQNHLGADLITIRSAGDSRLWMARVPVTDIKDNLGAGYVSTAAWVAYWNGLAKAPSDTTTGGVAESGDALTQVVNASGDNLFVSTPIREISATLTRPADTENYTANDHISAAVANVKQKEIVSLTGTSGTANITGTAGLTKLVTFATAGTQDLAQTAADFVTSHAAAYDALGIAVTAATTTIVFEAKVAGVPFTAPTITNVTPDLAGTVAHTTPNVTLVPVILDDMVADLGEGGIIMDVEVNTTITQLAGQTLRIWLFNATPSGIVGDNVAFTTLVANASKMVGSAYIDVELNALLTGSDCIVGKVSPAVAFKCAAADNTLYALIQTLGAATAPTSEGVINIKFTVMQITK
jgi:hypothetical protein